LAIAAITLWEIAWLVENGRIESTMSIESFIRECVSKVSVLPITPEIAVRAVSFPESYPKDPQDRLIGRPRWSKEPAWLRTTAASPSRAWFPSYGESKPHPKPPIPRRKNRG
jgi:hypothetical protein